MKLTDNDKRTIRGILGYTPNKEMMLMILKDVEAGMTVKQSCYRYTIPEVIILEDDEDPPEVDPDLTIPTVIVRGVNHKSNKR